MTEVTGEKFINLQGDVIKLTKRVEEIERVVIKGDDDTHPLRVKVRMNEDELKSFNDRLEKIENLLGVGVRLAQTALLLLFLFLLGLAYFGSQVLALLDTLANSAIG